MTTPSATPGKRRKRALLAAVVGAVVSVGAISGTASAAIRKSSDPISTTDEVTESSARSGIRW
jgi:hypothetical protein